jgi:hypothetical protein
MLSKKIIINITTKLQNDVPSFSLKLKKKEVAPNFLLSIFVKMTEGPSETALEAQESAIFCIRISNMYCGFLSGLEVSASNRKSKVLPAIVSSLPLKPM